jgi:hypothetical protein
VVTGNRSGQRLLVPEQGARDGGLAWETVRDSAGLLRAEIRKADGRRLTVYRRPNSGTS